MCGIGGIYRMENNPITAEEIVLLLCSLEHRGNHATGIALHQADGQIEILKDGKPAWSFTASEEFKSFVNTKLLPTTRSALLHTRFATQGNPFHNENNHPMFAGKVAVIHNGCIRNDWTLFREMNLDKSCETDSDIFRAILDKSGFNQAGVNVLNKIAGSGAIAAVSTEFPDKLLLARSGNPIVFGYTNDKLYFASELECIQKATRPWEQIKGLWLRTGNSRETAFNSMPDNTAYMMGPDGLEWRQEFKICTTFTPARYTCYTNYEDRMDGFRKSKRVKRTEDVPKEIKIDMAQKDASQYNTSYPDRSYKVCLNCVTVQYIDRRKWDWKKDKINCVSCKRAMGA